MTDILREKIARKFRHLLDAGKLRKEALLAVRQEFGSPDGRLLGYVSVYRYCKRFGISTK